MYVFLLLTIGFFILVSNKFSYLGRLTTISGVVSVLNKQFGSLSSISFYAQWVGVYP